MLFGQRSAPVTSQLSGDVIEAERERWHTERRMLLDDSASIRKAADDLERTLTGWSTLAHDLLFYGLFYGRRHAWISLLEKHLRSSVGEVEGVLEVRTCVTQDHNQEPARMPTPPIRLSTLALRSSK